jgi:hypothetical protein
LFDTDAAAPHESVLDRAPPVVRTDDPPTSHEAARLVAPHRTSRKGRVLAELKRAAPGWVHGAVLCSPAVGGSEGLRRLRELRQAGVVIETRPTRFGETGWEYRLVEWPD